MVDVTLPSLGESVTEGIITQWFKKVGDAVVRDEPLFEVSTDKVDSEMPSPAAGVLVEILAGEGDTVETGSRVAVIDENAQAQSPSEPGTAPSSTLASTPTSTAPARLTPDVASATTPSGVVVSPVVRRILSDGGVEPSTVQGSGPGGSITRRDAERAVLNGPTEEVVVPLSNGRRRMGQHMSVSTQSTPHGFAAIEIDGTIFGELERVGRTTRDGVLISDEYTNVTKRRAMMEKRQRKVAGIEASVPKPRLEGPPDADVTLIGWGSTDGTIREAREMLAEQGISTNQLQIRYLVPLHGDAIVDILGKAKHTIIIENNLSGQFARYLRSETSFVANGHIRKYDGEPFMPHHIVKAVREQLAGRTTLSVPTHEVMV